VTHQLIISDSSVDDLRLMADAMDHPLIINDASVDDARLMD
jgi:hypothetical protein